MENLSTAQMINQAESKAVNLVFAVGRLHNGTNNYEDVIDLIEAMYNDQLDLIDMVNKLQRQQI